MRNNIQFVNKENAKKEFDNEHKNHYEKAIDIIVDLHKYYEEHDINKNKDFILVAFEGADGTGKTSFIKGFIDNFVSYENIKESYEIVYVKDEVKDFANDYFYDTINFALARYINMKSMMLHNNNVKNVYKKKMVLFYDRYIYSTFTYQLLYHIKNGFEIDHGANPQGIEDFIKFIYYSSFYITPDIVIYFDEVIDNRKLIFTEIPKIYEDLFSKLSEKYKNLVRIKAKNPEDLKKAGLLITQVILKDYKNNV
ncbi:MAG: hypothetical protein QXF12_00560 [Candidatus Aenigmatarchaeota archaeon]